MSVIELKQLTATVLQHADRDGSFDTKVPGLALYRSSEPTVHDAVVYMPSLCARLRQIIAPGTPAQRISRAIGWLKEHYAEPARVEDLAKRVALSPSAFHLHFKAVTGLSPLQYQKRFRLQEARRLMLSDGLDAAEAAFRVGYESPSQFGREYRRLFGTPPRQDIDGLTKFAQPASPSGV